MKTALITGGAGFVGSPFALFYKSKCPDQKVICPDNLKSRGSELNLKRLKEQNTEPVHGDIRQKENLNAAQKTDAAIKCSAEPPAPAGLNTKGRLVLSKRFLPFDGWNANINSFPYPVENTYSILSSVQLPTAQKPITVHLTYGPGPFYKGLFITIIAILALISLLTFKYPKRKKR